MKAFLMYPVKDLDMQETLPSQEAALTQDLELDTLCGAMADGDELIFNVARHALLSACRTDRETLLYRQDILRDCLHHPEVIRRMYEIVNASIAAEKKSYFRFHTRSPGLTLRSSIEVLNLLLEGLTALRDLAVHSKTGFDSEGLFRCLSMIERDLPDAYFAEIRDHLEELRFPHGVLIGARLRRGNKGSDYRLHKPVLERRGWRERLFTRKPPAYSFRLHPRDEAGARALSELRDRGINPVANALAQSTDHILDFLGVLRSELAFHVGCINLHLRLSELGGPVCFPVPTASGERRHSFSGLYDVCLALATKKPVTGNDGNADDMALVVITGANQGGKSTFLRSVGVSQLMMQCGMFVPAKSYSANLCEGVFTHARREEDSTMVSGKLDEELGRFSEIVDELRPDAMLLLNESFAMTNEREGSEIARQIYSSLLEKRIKVLFVTHLYEFAHDLAERQLPDVRFLRAERRDDGTRTFRVVEGLPLATSHGKDLYDRIFGRDGEPGSLPGRVQSGTGAREAAADSSTAHDSTGDAGAPR